MADAGWIDDLETDLGLTARLRLIANAGGQRRFVPQISRAGNSRLAGELGADTARWLALRFGGTEIEIPSRTGDERRSATAKLVADILEAGLTNPTRSINDLAAAHGVSRRWVLKLRRELRHERPEPLPLFGDLPEARTGETVHRAQRRR